MEKCKNGAANASPRRRSQPSDTHTDSGGRQVVVIHHRWVTAGETVVQSEESKREDLCTTLDVPQNVRRQANSIWQQLQSSELPDFQTEEIDWYICLLYIAAIDTRLPYGPGDPQSASLHPPCVTVTDLLTTSNISILDFFRKLRVIRESRQVSDAVLHELTTLERKYLITCPLFHKFERMFDEIFQRDEVMLSGSSTEDDSSSELENFEGRKKFCWLLFVLAKGVTLGGSLELVLTFHLLLCCMDFVVRLTPAFQLKAPFDAARMVAVDNSADSAVLRQLCQKFHANLDEVKTVWVTYLQSVVNDLPQNQGTVDVTAVLAQYHSLYRQQGDVDEMLFLQHSPHLVTTRESNNNNVLPVGGATRQMPQTPVRAAMTTVRQLWSLLESSGDGPSTVLNKYFQNCSVDPTPAVKARIQQMEAGFMQHFSQTMGDNLQQVAKQRFQLAVKLHYRVMEALLKQEEERLSQADFSNLLNNAVFHKCLLGCAVEVVLTTYGGNSFNPNARCPDSPAPAAPAPTGTTFPWVLGVFKLQAYDFLKVLGSFIKAEPRLTRDVIKHLQHVENQILEQLGWQEGSPVFDAYTSHASGEVNKPSGKSLLDTPGANTSPADLYLSPLRRQNHSHSTGGATSVGQESAGGSTPTRKSNSLNLFFNKACRLGYHRIQTLCNNLGIPKDLQQKIWTCLEHCITQQPTLMKNRHLDQIMLCCIYAICKVTLTEKEVRFKTIVNEYRDIPPNSQQVYKQVLIAGNVHDTIIGFYNRVFMQELKSYILQFSANKVQTLSPLPRSPCHGALTASPVYVLPGKKNFFVSPLKSSPFKLQHLSPREMTPRTQQLYSFGEVLGSAEKLKVINDAMRMAQASSPRQQTSSQKRLRFDQPDDSNGCEETQLPAFMVMKKKQSSQTSRKCLSFAEPNAGSPSKKQKDG